MIQDNVVNGSMSTTLHTFTVSTSGMDIVVSSGEYYRGGQVLFSDADGGTITIPTTANISYELFLMTDGSMSLFQYTDVTDLVNFCQENKSQIIDKLLWFTIGDSITSLDDVIINFVKVIDNAN